MYTYIYIYMYIHSECARGLLHFLEGPDILPAKVGIFLKSSHFSWNFLHSYGARSGVTQHPQVLNWQSASDKPLTRPYQWFNPPPRSPLQIHDS